MEGIRRILTTDKLCNHNYLLFYNQSQHLCAIKSNLQTPPAPPPNYSLFIYFICFLFLVLINLVNCLVKTTIYVEIILLITLLLVTVAALAKFSQRGARVVFGVWSRMQWVSHFKERMLQHKSEKTHSFMWLLLVC